MIEAENVIEIINHEMEQTLGRGTDLARGYLMGLDKAKEIVKLYQPEQTGRKAVFLDDVNKCFSCCPDTQELNHIYCLINTLPTITIGDKDNE